MLKAENLQRTGSFKIRGAMSKLAALGDDAAAGVTAGSAGNHAQALAFAARHAGVPCEIFVPSGAPVSKIEACRAYGATLIEGGDSLDEAVAAARERAADAGMVFCHPYDDVDVVAGQATLGRELIDDVSELRRVVVPLGGGGLACGIAIAVKAADPTIEVIGVQVAACAPYAHRQPPTGPVVTLADGIAVKRPGEITRPLVEQWLDDVVVVEENAVADAMVLLMERAKFFVEGAGAVGVAALLSQRLAPARTGTTCVVLSGGNVDLGILPGSDPPPRDPGRQTSHPVRPDQRSARWPRQVADPVRRARRQPGGGRTRSRRGRSPCARDGGAGRARGPRSWPCRVSGPGRHRRRLHDRCDQPITSAGRGGDELRRESSDASGRLEHVTELRRRCDPCAARTTRRTPRNRW